MDKPQLMLEQVGDLLRLHGYRITNNYLSFLCRPSVGKGPPSSGRRGRAKLFDPDTSLAWGKQYFRERRI
jgi:hypothetical protein